MTQQVNLYQPILREQKKVFSAVTMMQVLGTIAVLMLLIYGFSYWQLVQLENQNRQLRAQQGELAERVTRLTRESRSRPESRELRRRVEAAERELELKQRLAVLLQDRPIKDGGEFSEAFAGLARQRVGGLWLTGIELRNVADHREVTLRGHATRAELVPKLVQLLGTEPAFQGLRFRGLHVFQSEDPDVAALSFELTTEPEKEESR